MRRPIRSRLWSVVVALSVGGCAGNELPPPVDPVDEVHGLLSDLASAGPSSACAASLVEVDRQFLMGSRPTRRGEEPLLGSRSSPTRRTLGAQTLNFSQASLQMSQGWEFQKSADRNVQQGRPVPGGWMPGSAAPGLPPYNSAVARGGHEAAMLGRWARAYFASGWTMYYAAETGEADRERVLDALTSWSLNDPEMLRDYSERIRRTAEECAPDTRFPDSP